MALTTREQKMFRTTCPQSLFLLLLFRTSLLAVVAGLGNPPSSVAATPSISVMESWVEYGHEFHVGFQATASNASCRLRGEGLIEFEVSYYANSGSSVESVFGLAIWYPSDQQGDTVSTHGKALGPQGLCTERSPCRLHSIRIVNVWCPPAEGPLYSW